MAQEPTLLPKKRFAEDAPNIDDDNDQVSAEASELRATLPLLTDSLKEKATVSITIRTTYLKVKGVWPDDHDLINFRPAVRHDGHVYHFDDAKLQKLITAIQQMQASGVVTITFFNNYFVMIYTARGTFGDDHYPAVPIGIDPDWLLYGNEEPANLSAKDVETIRTVVKVIEDAKGAESVTISRTSMMVCEQVCPFPKDVTYCRQEDPDDIRVDYCDSLLAWVDLLNGFLDSSDSESSST